MSPLAPLREWEVCELELKRPRRWVGVRGTRTQQLCSPAVMCPSLWKFQSRKFRVGKVSVAAEMLTFGVVWWAFETGAQLLPARRDREPPEAHQGRAIRRDAAVVQRVRGVYRGEWSLRLRLRLRLLLVGAGCT